MFRRRRSARPSAPVAEPAPVDPFLTLLDERTHDVTAALTDAAGGASLCSLSRSGGPVDGVKYLEGRMAVLMELSRQRRRAASEPAELVGSVAASWRRELAESQDRDRGPMWIAYRAGGVDELEELVERLAGSAE